jgi:hypothetical protein
MISTDLDSEWHAFSNQTIVSLKFAFSSIFLWKIVENRRKMLFHSDVDTEVTKPFVTLNFIKSESNWLKINISRELYVVTRGVF